ncbi:transmembrane protein, putative (macronuclear) [Tetrahymena thermophila SB210]|uniref:Transmembrane protein, putative n=1 Tax=Tetrahymena thermophila (strain SB210) TaxID=312017 RepID=I7ML92_TETTS|nr:transmembrane protein, putative [Tetrahymena thermophila SB210]EAS01407.2 transmembrane protein, putative [Tetrahymena thermophila SB210]|eukprot:XP_001021653.2 transmembrane protein, putative [Tetrahymena thermophila SB210]
MILAIHKSILIYLVFLFSHINFLKGQAVTFTSQSPVVLNTGPATLQCTLTSQFANSQSPFKAIFYWVYSQYAFTIAEQIYFSNNLVVISQKTQSPLSASYFLGRIEISFSSQDIDLTSGVYSVTFRFTNFKNPFSTRVFGGFQLYLISANGQQLQNTNISLSALTQEITRSTAVQVVGNCQINSNCNLLLQFTTTVSIDKQICAIIVNIGQGKSYQLTQINNQDGALVQLSDGVYLLPNIFKNFPTDYQSSKQLSFNLVMSGFTYAQTVQFTATIVENALNYPKMETIPFTLVVQPLQIQSSASISIPNTSSKLVGENSIYLIDFTLSLGFQKDYTLIVGFDSSLISINDLTATNVYDIGGVSNVLIATTPVLDNSNSIIKLTQSNYDQTASYPKKQLRIQISVKNPLSTQSQLHFSISTAFTSNTQQVLERLDASLNIVLQPNVLSSLTITPQNLIVGQLSVYDIKFTVKTQIPQGGMIKIYFPPDTSFPFYKAGGTQAGSLNTVQPVTGNISPQATISLDSFPCNPTNGCIASINNAILTTITGGSVVEFTLNFIRNLFSTKPAFINVATFDQNNLQIDSRQTQFQMQTPNKFNFVQIKQQTSIVGQSSYYDFNIQFNTTHYNGYILFITYPQQIQPNIQNVNGLTCTGLEGLIQDLGVPDQSCVVTNVNGVNKIQIILQFLDANNPSRSIKIRVSSFTNYFLANQNFQFGLETVIKESAGNNQFNIFYVESLFNDPTLQVTMTTNVFQSLLVSTSPGIMNQNNDITVNITPNTVPQSNSLTFYIKFQLSPLLNVNSNQCANYFIPPSNTVASSCSFSSNTFSIAFSILGTGNMKFVLKQVNYPFNTNTQAFITVTTYSTDLNNNIYPMDYQVAVVPLSCQGLCQTCISAQSSQCLSCYSGFYLDGQTCVTQCPPNKYPIQSGNIWKCEACINNCQTCQLDATNNYQCLTCIANYVQTAYDTCSSNCLPGTFKNQQNPPSCDKCSTSCYECVNANNNCTSCNTQITKKYLFKNQCLSSCPIGTYPNNLLGTCSQCHSNCTQCTDYTVCQACQLDFKYLVNNFCYSTCPNTTVKNSQDQCVPCTNNCLTCQLTTDNCTSCNSGYYLVGSVCSATCPLGQVGISGICVSCTPPCTACKNIQTSCTKCDQNTYLTGDSCVQQAQCPSGTYGDNSLRSCVSCKNNCLTCSDEITCKSCNQNSSFNKFYNGQCLQACPSSTYLDNPTNICKPCAPGCLQCSLTSCSQCDLNSQYPILINGQCLQNCPSNIPIYTSYGCQPCSSKCLTCQNSVDYCLKCSSGMSSLNGDCLSTCPQGYISVLGVCQEEGTPASSLIILPFFIGSVAIAMVLAFYFYWNRDMLYSSNFIAVFSLLELGAWLFYIGVFAQFKGNHTETQYSLSKSLYAFLFGILAYILMNIAFFIYFRKIVFQDTRFRTWLTQKSNNSVYKGLSYFGLVLSFKMNRLLYGRLCSLSYFSAEFNDNQTIFKPTNIFSVASLILNNLPIFISACMTLDTIQATQKDSQLYINGIEVILMNIFMFILVLLDFHKPQNYFNRHKVQKSQSRVYVDDSGYGMMGLNENQSVDYKHMMDNYHQFSRIKSPTSMDQSALNSAKINSGLQTPQGAANPFNQNKNRSKIFDENGNVIHEEDNDDDENLDSEAKNKNKKQNHGIDSDQQSIDIENVSKDLENTKKKILEQEDISNQNIGTKNSELGGQASSQDGQDIEAQKNNKLLSSTDTFNGQNLIANKIGIAAVDNEDKKSQNLNEGDQLNEQQKLQNENENKQNKNQLSQNDQNGQIQNNKSNGDEENKLDQANNNKDIDKNSLKQQDAQNQIKRGRQTNSNASQRKSSNIKGDQDISKTLKSQKSSSSIKNNSPAKRNKSLQSQPDQDPEKSNLENANASSKSIQRSSSAKKPLDKNDEGFMSGKECHHLLRVYERSTSQASKSKNGQQSPSRKQSLNNSQFQASSRNPRDTIAGSKNKKMKNQKSLKEGENDYEQNDSNNTNQDGNYNPMIFTYQKQRSQLDSSNASNMILSPSNDSNLQNQDDQRKSHNAQIENQLDNKNLNNNTSLNKLKRQINQSSSNLIENQQQNSKSQNLFDAPDKNQNDNTKNNNNLFENSSNIVTSQIIDQDEEANQIQGKNLQNPLENTKQITQTTNQQEQSIQQQQQFKDPQSQKEGILSFQNQINNQKPFTPGQEIPVDLEEEDDSSADGGLFNQDQKKKRKIDPEDVGEYFNESQGSMVQDTPSNYNEQNMRFAITNQGIIDAHMKLKKRNEEIVIPIQSQLNNNTQESQESNNNLEKYKKKNPSKKNGLNKTKKNSQKAVKQIKKGPSTIEYSENNVINMQENENNIYKTIDQGQLNKDLQKYKNTQSSSNSINNNGKFQLNSLDPRTLSPKVVRNALKNNFNKQNSNNNFMAENSNLTSPDQQIHINYNDEEPEEISYRQKQNKFESQTINVFMKNGQQSPSNTIGGASDLKKKPSLRKNVSKSLKRSTKQLEDNTIDYGDNNHNNLYDIHFPAVENNIQEFSDFNSIDYNDIQGQNSQYDSDNFRLPSLPKTNPRMADLEKIYLQRLESLPKSKINNHTTNQPRHKSLQKPRGSNKNQIDQDYNDL